VPVIPIAIPISARLMAGASLTPIAGHCHDFMIGLQRVHDAKFVLGRDPRKDIRAFHRFTKPIVTQPVKIGAGQHFAVPAH